MSIDDISFDEFKSEWLEDIKAGSPTSVEKGHRFAKKLVMQWTDWTEASENDLSFCDGSGDGGIDAAFLQRGAESGDSAESKDGDIWYIVQSKYGSAFQGVNTLLQEAQKVIETIDGKKKNKKLSSDALSVIEQIQTFRSKAGDRDRLVLVFATIEPLSSEEELRVVEDIKAMGRSRFGALFSVENVSVRTIYDRTLETPAKKSKIPFTTNLAASGDELLVGSVKLSDLYEFMKCYKKENGGLDLLYEKNVRRFLGRNRKVNKGIEETLEKCPERFGLFNNGITIVVEDFQKVNGQYELIDPYVVNGCQTTRTIWDFLEKKLASGGTGKEPVEFQDWLTKYERGIVVVKIVKAGEGNVGAELLNDTTRFTNSQNSITGKDFIALDADFKGWEKQIGERYDVFLEIQRGAWESRRALQKKNPKAKQFTKCISAFELIKVYAAAWLNEPGKAFGSNPPFVPGGAIFTQITENKEHVFGVDDLYAAYCLHSAV
jgi:hypothetical protein